MVEEEVTAFVAAAQAGYERQLTHFGGLTPDEARGKAAADCSRLFPDGRPATGMHLFVAEVAGTPVGHLWLAEQAPGGLAETAYIYDVEVRETQRGRGYGRAIMDAAERQAASFGATSLALNVFGTNRVARGLYESMGYQTMSVQMRKPLT